jgi:UDPglucose 6-dehydrogenase
MVSKEVNMQQRLKLSIIGLGKLGSPLAAVMAKNGFEVIGLDLNDKLVNALNAGRAPVMEPRLQEFIDQSKGRLRATTDYRDTVLNSDISFIIVPTPSGPDGFFTNKYVVAAVESIGAALRAKPQYHLIVVTSTVMPGSTDCEIREALERASGRRVGETVGLCYNPEFIALGSVIDDLLAPDFILIGESDERAGKLLADIYAQTCDNNPPVRRMNFVNAELCKISVNTFVTTKISYANMLAAMCDNLEGADVDVVTEAVGSDTRIGTKYLRGAIGYGGPCFPRDNKAFAAVGRRLGVRCDIAEATDRINDHQIDRLCGAVEARIRSGGTIGILGLSYKPDTGVIEESQGVALARALAREGYAIEVFDPLALESAMAVLGTSVTAAKSAEACAASSDLLVITTPWKEFASLPPSALRATVGRKTVIDPWRVLDLRTYGQVAEVIHLGRGTWKASPEETLTMAKSIS